MSLGQQREFLHKRFEQQAAKTPDNMAVIHGEQSLTYAELNSRSDQLAQRLSEKIRRPEDFMGLFMTRSLDLIIGMIAILKAGAAYVPIDPDYPPERIGYLLKDSGVKTVVSRLTDKILLSEGYDVVCVDDTCPYPVSKRAENLEEGCRAAYVIYTSGSTGKPKGTIVEHENVISLFENCDLKFEFSSEDIWSVFHSFSFDFSVWELWGALLHGGSAVIIPSEILSSPLEFARFSQKSRISMLSMTPTSFTQFAKAAIASDYSLAHLRSIILGGEKLQAHHVKDWLGHFSSEKVKLINMYGITETTVHVTYRQITEDFLDRPDLSPIGTPIIGMKIHLLDQENKCVSLGDVGEIVVTGSGVARGYLGRAELTEQYFPMLPLGKKGQLVKAYRSGDLAREENGEFMYLGRKDNQVKLRGYRIEPREIELHLEQSPHVSLCKVIVQHLGEGDCRLIAFVVPHKTTSGFIEKLKLLSLELPSYMQPAFIVEIAALPTTIHGKCDEKRLLKKISMLRENDLFSMVGGHQFIAIKIDKISRRILRQQNLNWYEDIFDQGVTSLSFVRILIEVNSAFNICLSGRELEGDASINNIATVIQTLKNNHSLKKEAVQCV